MNPIDTHHLTLSIYFDFLEDNNHDTAELRLFESKQHWHFLLFCSFISLNNVGFHYPGIDTFDAFDHVGSVSTFSDVGSVSSRVGTVDAFDNAYSNDTVGGEL